MSTFLSLTYLYYFLTLFSLTPSPLPPSLLYLGCWDKHPWSVDSLGSGWWRPSPTQVSHSSCVLRQLSYVQGAIWRGKGLETCLQVSSSLLSCVWSQRVLRLWGDLHGACWVRRDIKSTCQDRNIKNDVMCISSSRVFQCNTWSLIGMYSMLVCCTSKCAYIHVYSYGIVFPHYS